MLESLERKLSMVRDRVRGVATRLHTGFYLWGSGGIGKSYTVLKTLEDEGHSFELCNSRMTGRGLVDLLMAHPDALVVLEDCESMFRDKMALGVLRSALWGQSGPNGVPVRKVTWNALNTTISFNFIGGIIILCNTPPDKIPEIQAISTRINPLCLVVTDEEIIALMRSMATKGFEYDGFTMRPRECGIVVEHIIKVCAGDMRRLDMRLLRNCYNDYLLRKEFATENSWEDIVEHRIREATTAPLSRAEIEAKEIEVAKSLVDLPTAKKISEWKRLTGKGKDAMYARLR